MQKQYGLFQLMEINLSLKLIRIYKLEFITFSVCIIIKLYRMIKYYRIAIPLIESIIKILINNKNRNAP